MGPLRTGLVGILPPGHRAEAPPRTGEMGPQAYPEVLLVEMAQPGRATTETAALGFARSRFGCGDESSRRLECGQTAGVTPCAQQRDPAPVRFSPTIGSCGP